MDSANKPASDTQYIQYRRCHKCANTKMEPAGSYRDSSGFGFGVAGKNYQCPQCSNQQKIRNTSSLVTGGFIAFISAIVSWWAFKNGPLWYASHLSYYTQNSYEASFIILDILAFGFYAFLTLLGIWIIWSEFIAPLIVRMRYPVTGENRTMNVAEATEESGHTKNLWVSFFLYPLLVYVPLFGGIWILDWLGIDIRENEAFKFIGIALLFAVIIALAKRFNVEFGIVFFGLVFWMAAAVATIFALG